MGFARRISEEKGNSLQSAQTIMDSAQTMQKIVNNVLDFAKPMQLDLKDCNLGETILCAVDVCRTKAVERGIPLMISSPTDLSIVRIDSFHVERALVNLIDNAVDASHSGEQVLITTATDRKNIFVIIQDHGEGMDRETLAHLFEPFYTTKSTGTGLGMPIAKKIFEEHGGALSISSKQGVGTEATVRLPISGKSEV